MPGKKLKKLREIAQTKADFVDEKLEKIDKLLDQYGILLTKKIFDEFLNELDVENGSVLTTEQNVKRTSLIDRAFVLFNENAGYRLVNMFVQNSLFLLEQNKIYFNELSSMSRRSEKQIQNTILSRLGMTADGELKRNGFMRGVFDAEPVRKQVIDFGLQKVTSGTGFEDLRRGYRDLIAGNDEKMGAFKQFYRNAAYDIYVRTDAAAAKLHADELKLEYFIYAGTKRKHSRLFCVKRKGQVFSRTEAETWKDLIGTKGLDENGKLVPAGPIVTNEDISTYNPFVDRGGYGCVDDVMFVSEEIAFDMRPELKK